MLTEAMRAADFTQGACRPQAPTGRSQRMGASSSCRWTKAARSAALQDAGANFEESKQARPRLGVRRSAPLWIDPGDNSEMHPKHRWLLTFFPGRWPFWCMASV